MQLENHPHLPEWIQWRQHLHQHPELGYDLFNTHQFVAAKLTAWGIPYKTYAKTGIVCELIGKHPGKRLGIRADMDALPLCETSTHDHVSQEANRMHACGHDGHTSILLATLDILQQDRDFCGTLVAIFQPAEEGGAGAKAMIDEGLLHDFPLDEIYALHNWPGLALGDLGITPGYVMAAADQFEIHIQGKGGHAAMPHLTRDPLVLAAQMVINLQSLISRRLSPFESAVISVTQIHTGTTNNIVPDEAFISGTLRSFSPLVREEMTQAMTQMVNYLAQSYDMQARLVLTEGYPSTRNHPQATEVLRHKLSQSWPNKIHYPFNPSMGAEDFSFFLEKIPGVYVRLGNGDSAGLHHPAYDFADANLIHGPRLWLQLVDYQGIWS